MLNINIKINSRTESFQEGSINHPSHTMYPQCHHCPGNSSYEDCVSKSTLKKCDNGLNNICFAKSFHSDTRGVIYEMGCSNHKQCQKAKAAPCKGKHYMNCKKINLGTTMCFGLLKEYRNKNFILVV